MPSIVKMINFIDLLTQPKALSNCVTYYGMCITEESRMFKTITRDIKCPLRDRNYLLSKIFSIKIKSSTL